MDEKQEYMMKLQLLEQEANQLGEQIKLVDQQINELGFLKNNIERLEKAGEEEMFSELGKGIYVRGQLKKADLLIDVGSKVLVPKSYNQIKEIVKDQVEKFEQAKHEIGHRIEMINEELNRVINDTNKGRSSEVKQGKGKEVKVNNKSAKKKGKSLKQL